MASLAIWLLMLQISEIPILRLLESFSNGDETEPLFLAAALLIGYNAIRAIPLYLGCFYLGDGLGRYGGMLPLVVIPFSYYLLELFSGDRTHHFGMPAVMGIVTVFVLQLLIRNVPGRFNRSIALSLFVFSFQWLNIAPFLTPYGFGQGQLTLTIKNMAELSELSSTLDLMGLGGFAIAFIGALMAAALLVSIDRNARQFRRLMEQNETLAVLREEALRARMTREIQSLVHDLRRPLTAIQGLTDVLAATAGEGDAREYAEKAGTAAESMSRIIDEILHEDGRSRIDARELLDYTMGQISPMPWHPHVRTLPPDEAVVFYGNRIRLSRALVNLVENAWHAVRDLPDPEIAIRCLAGEGSIAFSVRDNGRGLPDGFAFGTSGHGSTGLGLAVAQSVAANHGGSFVLRNHPDGGAEAVLSLEREGSGQ